MAKVTLYTTGTCPYCIRAKQLLDSKGAKYEEILVNQDPAKMQEMLSRSHNARTVPQIFIGETHVGGFDEMNALNRAGKLDELLNN